MKPTQWRPAELSCCRCGSFMLTRQSDAGQETRPCLYGGLLEGHFWNAPWCVWWNKRELFRISKVSSVGWVAGPTQHGCRELPTGNRQAAGLEKNGWDVNSNIEKSDKLIPQSCLMRSIWSGRLVVRINRGQVSEITCCCVYSYCTAPLAKGIWCLLTKFPIV